MTHHKTRWPAEKANAWYADLPWIVGCNFIPSNAINQLEMWQADTFDPGTIQRELGFARDLGMNAVRVYLHDLAFASDPNGFLDRMEKFLQIASSLGIRTLFVIFDDCWLPGPAPGRQPAPIPGVHNSGWVQSPGVKAAAALSERPRLERYVRSVLAAFGKDQRVLMWDIYNELGNIFLLTLRRPWYVKWPLLLAQFPRFELFLPAAMSLCVDAFGWARDAAPDQPLTTSVYFPNPRLNRQLLLLSDVITFHNYEKAESLEKQIRKLRATGRPLICTEWLARTASSCVESHLPIFKRERVGCFNWGLVSGKTQTIYSWDNPGVTDPVWFHDLLHADGQPYSESEAAAFRSLTQA